MTTKSDPWSMQRQLMEISGQRLPATPSVNETSVLYVALQLEEIGELLEAVKGTLEALPGEPADMLWFELDQGAKTLVGYSRRIRGLLVNLGKFELTPSPQALVEIGDATADIAVVNAGFAEASGLPGCDLYLDVQGSNLSKANPATGLIEKDASGKWIKGTAYRPPNIQRVLQRAAEISSQQELPPPPAPV